MAKIIYGVCGEGNGHSTRSEEIINHLIEKGHKVIIFAYGKSYDNLKDKFICYDTKGMRFSYLNNKVDYFHTVLENLKKSPELIKKLFSLSKIFTEFDPDIVISDFEFTTFFLANINFKPIISIDNQHIITNTRIKILHKYKKGSIAAKKTIRLISPFANAYIITTFFKEEKKNKKSHLVPPILRKEVFKIKPKKEDFILVYQTSDSNEKLLSLLKQINENFIIYGFNKDKKDNNLVFKKYNAKKFLNDLGKSKAVITNGGFTVITESLYLKKPILSQPVKNQFEQTVNAYYIKKSGYGEFCENVSLENIQQFIFNLQIYENNLKKYPFKNNNETFQTVDSLIIKLSKSKRIPKINKR